MYLLQVGAMVLASEGDMQMASSVMTHAKCQGTEVGVLGSLPATMYLASPCY